MSPSQRLYPAVILAALAALLLLSAAPVLGQTNPTVAACGLPVSGRIYSTVTYTLTANCAQTNELDVAENTAITITINGGGYTIGVGANFPTGRKIIETGVDTTLVVNNVTFDGVGIGSKTFDTMVHAAGPLDVDDVTFTNGKGAGLITGGNNKAVTGTLDDVLFENNEFSVFGHGGPSDPGGNSPGIVIGNNSTVTVNNAVFRNNFLGSSALHVRNGGALTLTGCLTFAGNVPANYFVQSSSASFTNNSTGACSGTIGNKGSAAIPDPTILACGLPAAGSTLTNSATYTQSADCTFNASGGGGDKVLWWLTEGVTITINGNGRLITGKNGNSYSLIRTPINSTLNINSSIITGVRLYIWGTLNVDKSTFRDMTKRAILQMGNGTIKNSTFSNISFLSVGQAVLGYQLYNLNQETVIENVVLTNISDTKAGKTNTETAPLAGLLGATLRLEGCMSYSNITPTGATFIGTVTNNSQDCTPSQRDLDPVVVLDPTVVADDGPTGQSGPNNPNRPNDPDGPVICNPHCHLYDDNGGVPPHCLRLGAIGLVCRMFEEPQPTVEIYGITGDSTGYFIHEVLQEQVDAVRPGGLVASAANGRVAVRVWEDRNITFQMGPTDEGKVHHLTVEWDLVGDVLGTIDTYGGPPGLDGVPAPAAEDPNIHVVSSGDTLHDIAARYGLDMFRLIEFNQLVDGGHMIYPGQQLRLPGSEGGGSAPVDTPAPLAKWVTAQEPGEDGTQVHVVQEGDTLWGIAVAYDVEPKTIMELNGFSGHGRGLWLAPGQRLLIHDGKTPPVASATST